MELMLDKKQIQVIFFFKLKMDCKATETTHNISSEFGPGTANSAVMVQGVLQRRQEAWRQGAQWLALEVDNDQLRAIIEAGPHTATEEVAEELKCWPFYDHWAFEANQKGEKAC